MLAIFEDDSSKICTFVFTSRNSTYKKKSNKKDIPIIQNKNYVETFTEKIHNKVIGMKITKVKTAIIILNSPYNNDAFKQNVSLSFTCWQSGVSNADRYSYCFSGTISSMPINKPTACKKKIIQINKSKLL